MSAWGDASTSRLSDADRSLVSKARALSAARGTDALRIAAGSDATDPAQVLDEAFGTAQFLLGELAALAQRLADR